MNGITVKKQTLIETLKKNRKNHRKVVEDAWIGYQKEATRLLEEQLGRAKKGLKQNLFISLAMPSDHTDDYDRVLQMMEMELNNEVVLSEKDFAQYVQDDWGWRDQWATTNSSYTAMVSAPS